MPFLTGQGGDEGSAVSSAVRQGRLAVAKATMPRASMPAAKATAIARRTGADDVLVRILAYQAALLVSGASCRRHTRRR